MGFYSVQKTYWDLVADTAKIETVIEETPTELFHIYKKTIDQSNYENHEDVLRLLLWVAFAKGTVYTSDLGVAVSMGPK